VNEGKKILMESGFNFVVAETMKDAADKVVAAAKGVPASAEWR
jgi:succinyl-CoA synthetase beta subunit